MVERDFTVMNVAAGNFLKDWHLLDSDPRVPKCWYSRENAPIVALVNNDFYSIYPSEISNNLFPHRFPLGIADFKADSTFLLYNPEGCVECTGVFCLTVCMLITDINWVPLGLWSWGSQVLYHHLEGSAYLILWYSSVFRDIVSNCHPWELWVNI